MTNAQTNLIFPALDSFQIELPSWGFANTGTRFGKFVQPAAATTLEEKFSDAGQVHALTGVCPTVALHVLWDLPEGIAGVHRVEQAARRYGVRAGSINPNVFQDQISTNTAPWATPIPRSVARRSPTSLDSVDIARELSSRDISLWFADGSNYPGTQNIRQRKRWFDEGLECAHRQLSDRPADAGRVQTLRAGLLSHRHRRLGHGSGILAAPPDREAKVLVDTGHHYQAQNIEQIVAWLLDLDMLGGFHFNDRRYADDDLTLGSIDPYQVFRIFHEIQFFEWETGRRRRYRLHDRPEPQFEGQDRGDDSDGDHCAGAMRQGSAGRSSGAGASAGALLSRSTPKTASKMHSRWTFARPSPSGPDLAGCPKTRYRHSVKVAISSASRPSGPGRTRPASPATREPRSASAGAIP